MSLNEFNETDERIEDIPPEINDIDDSGMDLDEMISSDTERLKDLDEMLGETYEPKDTHEDLDAMLKELEDERPSISKDEVEWAIDNLSADELRQLRDSITDERIRIYDDISEGGDGSSNHVKKLGRRR